ncbi:MAG: sensor histidine kinase, partial [Gemmatimonadales bacterium]
VAALLEAQATAAGLSLSVSPAAATMVEADEHRIRQVLENLLWNAIRHTDAGGSVRLEVRREAGGVVVAVGDTGSGIAADDLPHIFDRYRKHPDSSGTGLGLAIARRLVEAHGGEIHAASERRVGTTITFTLPG